MKQVLQDLANGSTQISQVPCPRVGAGALLIESRRSLVSSGTERMLVDFGKASLLAKARQQPDKVRQVLEKARTDGLVPTLEAVRNKLDQPLPMGYCNAGVVQAVGAGVSGFAVGDRVASNGKHAEMVAVPVHLCAKIPDLVCDDEAAFTVIGAIALQGIRLVQPTLGEAVVVTGLGLIGLITVQLLRAHGCRVMGIDPDPAKLALAAQFGADTVNLSAGQDPLAAARAFSRERGVDAVIVTASTKSSEPIHQAALMCRKRGRIVLVGVTGLELSRADFYEKELTFQVSCSYGPGRYDPSYEDKGQDYPFGFVRWTEQRNLEAVLDMMALGQLEVRPLISHRFSINDAQLAYALIGSGQPSLGILLEYPGGEAGRRDRLQRTVALSLQQRSPGPSIGGPGSAQVQLGFIGAGQYASAVLIPAFRDTGATLRTLASSGGVSGAHAGRKYGFEETTTEASRIFADEAVDAVVVSTRHDSHARFVLQALAAGKHVFVEKPLCLTLAELDEIEQALAKGRPQPSPDTGRDKPAAAEQAPAPMLMVGFNRRFAPLVSTLRSLLDGLKQPKALVMTVNAGAIPADHWTQDRAIGGGRIIGEACHFVDLLRFLTGAAITHQSRVAMAVPTADTLSLQLSFADGSIGTIHYFANGSKAFPKERLEVFCAGRVLQLDNFRLLRGYGWPRRKATRLWRQDKGQKACAAAFVHALREGGPAPIPLAEILEVSRVTIELAGAGDCC